MSGVKRYRVETLANLIEAGTSTSDIFQQIDKLIAAYPSPPCPGNDMGSDEKWARLMLELPAFVFCLMRGQDELVGYWCVFPVNNDLYEKGLSGANINREIDSIHIDDFFIPGDYSLYFVDFFVYKHHRGFEANPLMYESFVKFLKNAAKKGYFVKRIFAHTSTHHSINLCRSAGFRYVTDHLEHRMLNENEELIPTKIHEIDFQSNPDARILGLNRELKDLYFHHFMGERHRSETDRDIESIELRLRQLIVERIGDGLGTIPPHIKERIDARIAAAASKNVAFDVSEYSDLARQLEFFDLREIEDCIVARANWSKFSDVLGKKEPLVQKFDQLAELRNAIRHSRKISPAARKEGEAAILWFNQVLARM